MVGADPRERVPVAGHLLLGPVLGADASSMGALTLAGVAVTPPMREEEAVPCIVATRLRLSGSRGSRPAKRRLPWCSPRARMVLTGARERLRQPAV